MFGGCNLICAEYGNALYAGNANNPYLVLIAAKNKDITSCNINEKTRFINARAFYNSFVTDVTISSGVTSIGACAINSERGFRKTQQKISNNIENSFQMIA